MAEEIQQTDDGGGGGDGQQQHDAERQEIEAKARERGWKPKSEWKGDDSHWVDAPDFVQRTETFVPFLQKQRQRLQGDLDTTNQKLTSVEAQLKETREALDNLTQFNEEMAKDRTERRKREIGGELTTAREAGNDVRVAELQNELADLVKPKEKAAPKTNGTQPAATSQPQSPMILPWVKEFVESNDTFFKDSDRIALFNSRMLKRRQDGDTRVGAGAGTDLLTEVRDEVDKILGGNSGRRAPSKTEASRSGGGDNGRGRGGEKSFFDLPPEAQSKCNAQEERFVGEKKTFKTQAAWRKHFATQYFSPSARAVSDATND